MFHSKINNFNGISGWLQSNHPDTVSGKHTNQIFSKTNSIMRIFLNENGFKVFKDNHVNAKIVSKHFNQFTDWCNRKYK
jgi:hypothetical protein